MKKKSSFFDDASWSKIIQCSLCGEDLVTKGSEPDKKRHSICEEKFLKEQEGLAQDYS